MEMSKAALPARRGHATAQDEQHPLFPLYRYYRSSMAAKLVDSSDFRDWLFQYEQQQLNDNAARHPRYSEFVSWMACNQAGARQCLPSKELPRGLMFPANFYFWLEGGRW